MPDVPTGLGSSSGIDRLNSLRQSSQSQLSLLTPRKIRIELLVGLGAFFVVIAALFFLFGSRSPGISPSTSLATATAEPIGQLRRGEAYIAIALEDGTFPPDVQKGDRVRIVVTPSPDGTGSTRGLDEKTIVESMSSASEAGGRYVMTVRGPESVAVAIAASGTIHVAVVDKAQS